jgi:mannose-6-phosphate isomerase-like protein (cupin superfamily)
MRTAALSDIEFSETNLSIEGTGGSVLRSVLDAAAAAVAQLPTDSRAALRGCVRGTGPGVSFRETIAQLERDHPISLTFPFEGSERVGGAVWPMLAGPVGTQVPPAGVPALAKLQWLAGADDLPMHAHTHSDRFIIVLEGRGFFHVSGQSADEFDGTDVRTIAARERDVFLFSRNTVHTFSTSTHDMTLLSVQVPFIPFDDPAQYTLPKYRWTARTHLDACNSRIVIPSGWTQLV